MKSHMCEESKTCAQLYSKVFNSETKKHLELNRNELKQFLKFNLSGDHLNSENQLAVYETALSQFMKAQKMCVWDIGGHEGIHENHPLQFLNNNVIEETAYIKSIRVYADSIDYVKNQTFELCKMALKKSAYSIQYIRNQTFKLCKMAVKKKGNCLQYIKKPSHEIRMIAAVNGGLAHVRPRHQTEEMCLAAVKADYRSLAFIKNQTEEMCIISVTELGTQLYHVHHQTEAICVAAMNSKASYLCNHHIKLSTPKIEEELALMHIRHS